MLAVVVFEACLLSWVTQNAFRSAIWHDRRTVRTGSFIDLGIGVILPGPGSESLLIGRSLIEAPILVVDWRLLC